MYMHYIVQLLYNIGYFGPYILNGISIFLLREKQTFMYIYILGATLNALLNYILKGIFKVPRPNHDKRLINLNELYNDHNQLFLFDNNKYGMPSGHSQSVMFSTLFVFLVTCNLNILFFFLIISSITGVQRVYFNSHTPVQVLVGLFIGGIMGYLFYLYGVNKMKGNLKGKKDDKAPL